MNKRGQMFMNGMPRSINIILALILIAVGGLGIFGASIGITIPTIPSIILDVLIVIGGLMVLLDGFVGVGMTGIMPKGINKLFGILIFLGGVALLLAVFNIIPVVALPLNLIYGVILGVGVMLLLDGILGTRSF